MYRWLFAILLACNNPNDKSDPTDSGGHDTGTNIDSTDDTNPDTALEDPCSGETMDGAVRACITVDTTALTDLDARISGFNLNLNHHGIQPWDPRLVERLRELESAYIRWPGGAASYMMDWRTGTVDESWAHRFNADLSCESDADCVLGGSCLPQPTAAEPDAMQCQTECEEDSDCGTGEVCLYEQCTLDCYVADPAEGETHYDDAVCEDTNDDGYSIDMTCHKFDADTYGCLGSKVDKYLSYAAVLAGKGHHPVGDFARLAEVTGNQLAIHANAITDSAESIGELASSLLERGIEVDLWQVGNEVFYFRAPTGPPTFWLNGADYSTDMREYVAEIENAYEEFNATLEPDRQVPMPRITISFSDAETSWQRVWDWGQDEQADPTAEDDSRPGVADDIVAGGRYFSATDFHWYPGSQSTLISEAIPLVNYDLTTEFEPLLSDFVLPLSCADEGGTCSSPDDPSIVISEYNIQTTWHTALSAVHAAEFVLRSTAEPRMHMLGFHSLVEGCVDASDTHRQTAKTAGTYNYFGVIDSAALDPMGDFGLDFGVYDGLPCLALRIVNPAVNNATHLLQTHIEGGTEVDAGEDMESLISVPALYAQAYRGEGMDHLVITNRSGTPHRVRIDWDGVVLSAAGRTQSVGAAEAEYRNCGDDELDTGDDGVCNPEGDIDLGDPEAWESDYLDIPAWGVVRLDMERNSAPIEAPGTVSVEPGERSATATWSSVEEAESYEVRWGVTPGARPERIVVDSQPCVDGSCTVELVGLAHEVIHELTIAGISDGEIGPASEVVEFEPLAVELFEGNWDSAVGSTTWTENEGILSTDGAAGVSYLPVADSPDWRDISVEVDFRLNCDCSVEDDCGRVGLAARWQDSSNHIKAFVEEDDGVCFVRLWRTSETAGNGNLARSADIGVPIGSGSGEVPLNDDGEPLFPEIPAIDDGEWHTLRLAVEGELVRAWLDDRLIAAATDDTYESGGAAIMVRTAEVDLDDFSVGTSTW